MHMKISSSINIFHQHTRKYGLSIESSQLPPSYLIGFLISRHDASLLAVELSSRVVHPSLDALVQCEAIGGHLVAEFGV